MSNLMSKSTYSCLSRTAKRYSHPDLQDGFQHSAADPAENWCLSASHQMHRPYWAAFAGVNFGAQHWACKCTRDTDIHLSMLKHPRTMGGVTSTARGKHSAHLLGCSWAAMLKSEKDGFLFSYILKTWEAKTKKVSSGA